MLATIIPDVMAIGETSFGTHEAGSYCIQYKEGAFRYVLGARFIEYAVVLPQNFLVWNDGAVALEIRPLLAHLRAEGEAVGYRYARRFTHTGGKIAFLFFDSHCGDNAPGSPSPTWELRRHP